MNYLLLFGLCMWLCIRIYRNGIHWCKHHKNLTTREGLRVDDLGWICLKCLKKISPDAYLEATLDPEVSKAFRHYDRRNWPVEKVIYVGGSDLAKEQADEWQAAQLCSRTAEPPDLAPGRPYQLALERHGRRP